MARLVGIDIRATQVRVALLRVRYKQLLVEHLLEVDRGDAETLEAILQTAFASLGAPIDGIAAAVDGERAFIRRITLPRTAARQIDEILPFELEAQVPVDLGELIYDHRLLKNAADDTLIALTASARTEEVSNLLTVVKRALGHELQRVGCGALPLANLARTSEVLRQAEPIGIVDLGTRKSDVVVLKNGEAVFARTISHGVEGLPESAPILAARLRQTFVAAGGEPLTGVYLTGAGVEVAGAEAYLAYELSVPVAVLPKLELQGLDAEQEKRVPRFAKALSLALSLTGRGDELDLRQGPLAFQRGYGFLKEKLPLLAGLGAAILISMIFATWAELRGLAKEHDGLKTALGDISEATLGTRADNADLAQELLSSKLKVTEDDPMPHMDAYGVILQLSNEVPDTVTHDVEEFDFQRNKLRITGVVGTTGEAQRIATSMGAHACLKDTKIAKVTQVINGDRQKYVLESEVECPEDAKSTKTSETKR